MEIGGSVPKKDTVPSLRRYTDILSVIDMFRNRRITLTSPDNWADRNDRHTMQRYASRLGSSGALAMCMTDAGETYHHWQIFAGTKLGACVIFDRAKLLALFSSHPEIHHSSVRYLEASELKRLRKIRAEDYPFLKRKVFEDEREYRAVALKDHWGTPYLNLAIEPSLVRRVVLGPEIPDQLMMTLEQLFRDCDGFAQANIHFSRMPENQSWRSAFDEVAWLPSDAPDFHDHEFGGPAQAPPPPY
jgi:hypothetical protein